MTVTKYGQKENTKKKQKNEQKYASAAGKQ